VAVGLRDGIWYSAAVSFLSLAGSHLGTYYHPGPLYLHTGHDSIPGLSPDILLYGLNSSARFIRELVPFETERHVACVVRLEPPHVTGQAYPYSEGSPEDRDWPTMERAEEKGYLLIPPMRPGASGRIDGIESKLGEDGEVFIEVKIEDGRIYTLKEDLTPVSLYLSVHGPAYQLRQEGRAQFLPLLHLANGIQTVFDEYPVMP
jgi:hypothetical protein